MPGSRFNTILVLIGGNPLDSRIELVALDVQRTINRIPVATLLVRAPGALTDGTPIMAGGPFAPGTEVEVKSREGDAADVAVFKGVVTLLGIRLSDGVPMLEVTLKDKALCLTAPRHSRIWADSTDADAIQAILQSASLTADAVPSSGPSHKSLVQHEATDWDFILTRADALGHAVVVQDGALSLLPMDPSGAAVRTLTLGMDEIYDLDFEIDPTSQYTSLQSMVWDPAELKAAAPADAQSLELPQSQMASQDLAAALRIGAAHLSHMVPLPQDEAKAWASARMARARLALIRGRVSLNAWPDAALMQVAELAGFGDELDGRALITGIRHRLDDRGFTTDLQFGLSPEPVGLLEGIADMTAGGLLPPITGLHTGTVIDNQDPDNTGRVQVRIPAIATDDESGIWARVLSPDAGKVHGFCFLPELDDEVLVGFLASDPRFPVVLGRLFGSKNTLPDGFTDNKQKGIVSAKGVKITFAEADKPSVTIATPDKRSIVLDDDAQAITLSDGNGNKIVMDSNGITIESGKDLTLKASGAVKVTGNSIDLN